MKKKLLVVLSIMVLALTCNSVFAKVKITSDLSEAINFYKAGNYSESYVKLNQFVAKDNTNALAYYYLAMVNAQMGKTRDAIDNYSKAIELATPNSNIYRYATKGKLCLEFPEKCTSSLYSSKEEEFIRSIKTSPFSQRVEGELERLRLEEMMREMNRSKDITPQNFRGFEDFSSMNINETPTNDEIVAALRVLQKAGLNGMVGTGDLSLLSGNSQQAQIMNMLGGSSMNSQLIQSLLTNNMSLGF